MTEQHQHIVKSYDEDQASLRDTLLHMGQLAASQLEASLDAVICRNGELAREVIGRDNTIDALEQQINADVIRLIQRGPLASDMRVILAALRVASDMERIGDYAANIAKRSLILNQSPTLPHTSGLEALGRLAMAQLGNVLSAYKHRDSETALCVRDTDAELDATYTALFRELLTYMMEDPRSITPCTHLLFMAKNLERVGDHVTNIAENVWFLLHGDTPLPPRDKRDDTTSIDGMAPTA